MFDDISSGDSIFSFISWGCIYPMKHSTKDSDITYAKTEHLSKYAPGSHSRHSRRTNGLVWRVLPRLGRVSRPIFSLFIHASCVNFVKDTDAGLVLKESFQAGTLFE